MALSEIKLNYVNRSDDTNNSSVVIFQLNYAEDFGEIAVAWKVIENCGRLDNHRFVYPLNFQVCASDAYGNYTPMLDAVEGQIYEMVKDSSGDVLRPATVPATNKSAVEVWNNHMAGAINAHIFRDGKLLAAKTNLAPGQKAVFQFYPRIYIGVVSQVVESQVISSAIISQINTEINLYGISSADIVLTGGGPGPCSSSFKFKLENINTV